MEPSQTEYRKLHYDMVDISKRHSDNVNILLGYLIEYEIWQNFPEKLNILNMISTIDEDTMLISKLANNIEEIDLQYRETLGFPDLNEFLTKTK